MSYTTGPPTSPAYSTTPHSLHPTTKTRTTEQSRYAKLVYKVQSAPNLRELCLRESSLVLVLFILVERVESAFSKEAGELSSA